MLNKIISERLPVRRTDEEIDKILNSESKNTNDQPIQENNKVEEKEPTQNKFINFPNIEQNEEIKQEVPTNNEETNQEEQLKPGKFFNILKEEPEEKKEEPQNEVNFDTIFMNPINTTTPSNALLDEIQEIENSINNSNNYKEEQPKKETQPEPIEEIDDFDADFDSAFEPLTEENPNLQEEPQETTQPETSEPRFIKPKIDNFKDVLQAIRECSNRIEAAGFIIDEEEYDLEGTYQVVFKIQKKD